MAINRVDLEKFLTNMGYKEVKRGTFEKEYRKTDANIAGNVFTTIYKFKKEVVTVSYRAKGNPITKLAYKGRLKSLYFDSNNQLNGLKRTTQKR